MTDFRKLLFARVLFNAAVNGQAVIVGWRMYELTHETWTLGLLGLAEAVPALGLAIFAGWVVDRSRPQRVCLAVLSGSLVSALVVAFSQWDAIGLGSGGQVAMLYLSAFVTGTARGFAQPAMAAVMPRLVPRAEIGRASAWMTSVNQSAAVLGPALLGLIYGRTDALTAAVTPGLLLSAAVLAWVSLRARLEPPARQEARSLGEELLGGAKFVFGHPILLPALSLDMLSVLFGGVEALLPVFASDVLMVGAFGLGTLRAAPALGSALAGFALTRVDLGARAGRVLFAAVTGFGACILVFGLSENYVLSLAALGLSGAFDGVSAVIRSTAVQLVSPDHMRGRISAINAIFIGSSNELGEFESGMAAYLFGTVPAVVLGGLACLLTVAVVAIRAPRLRSMNMAELEREFG